jgi:hypothetical protein
MGLRMPEPVTLGLDAMPSEPPVDHLTRSLRKTCEGSHVDRTVGKRRVSGLERKIPGLQETIDLRSLQGVARSGSSPSERLIGVIRQGAHLPAEESLVRSSAQLAPQDSEMNSPPGIEPNRLLLRGTPREPAARRAVTRLPVSP